MVRVVVCLGWRRWEGALQPGCPMALGEAAAGTWADQGHEPSQGLRFGAGGSILQHE